jgi:NADPH:quinone reductase-like Zn-dependent oxidoreductase
MPKAVQLSSYGDVDVLTFVERATPTCEPGSVVVRVVTAGINPGEISIRKGLLKDMFPMAFPFGQGTDFAGRVESVGAGVSDFHVGDDVLGWTEDRSAQAEYVATSPARLIAKPPTLDWFRAGSLFVTATTAFAAVRAVSLVAGETVAISGAAGGVGSLAVQLARRRGARVIGIASPDSARFLASVGVEHVAYGDGLTGRLRALAPEGIDAFVDLFGNGYVDTALELGIATGRIDTIIDFDAVQKHGIKAEGSAAAGDRATLAEMAELVAWGKIIMPIAAVYPFENLRDAYVELAKRKANGKIVLAVDPTVPAPLRPPASADETSSESRSR